MPQSNPDRDPAPVSSHRALEKPAHDNLMARLNIAAKIWLSIGIFILGFIVFTMLSQLQGLNLESRLNTLDQVLYPAVLGTRQAESAFEQGVKGFSDAVVVQERSSLDRGTDGVQHTIDDLHSVAQIRGLARAQQAEASGIASVAEEFLVAARRTYAAVLANPLNIDANLQHQMLDLASRTNSIRNSIIVLRDTFTHDLQRQLLTARARSARLRWFGLWVFASTLLI